jgi:polar amino acid transport system ATP-binding protein
MSDTRPMIEITNLRKQYGAHVVLHDISLTVPKGGVVALIGPSGSGKSTLLRCINLLETPNAGEIRVDDHAVRFGAGTKVPRAAALADFRAETGMVFQSFNLFPHMSVLQNVMAGPVYVRGQKKERARETAMALLERVGLAHKAAVMPASLSGGQKQRIAIARALAMDPKVMLFDEPTSALDPNLVGEVLGVMRDLAVAGMTMVVVTHEMAYARDVADTVVFMADGYVVEAGAARQVIEQPRDEKTIDFLKHFHMGRDTAA